MALNQRLDFIYAVSEAMNELERERDLDWAVLDCKKFEPGPRLCRRERRAPERGPREDAA